MINFDLKQLSVTLSALKSGCVIIHVILCGRNPHRSCQTTYGETDVVSLFKLGSKLGVFNNLTQEVT